MVRDSLDGRTALITGASSGIGRQTATVLARNGASVAVAARRDEKLEALAATLEDEYDARTKVLPTDISKVENVKEMVEATVEEFGDLDVVVCNAGVSMLQSVEEMETETFEQMVNTNVNGTFFTAQKSIPYLRETNGNLIFVGSYSSQHPIPAHPVYAASKWWARGFALSLAGQVGDEDIAVSIVHPSEVRTELGGSGDRRPTKDRYEPGEITEPKDIAEAIVFAAKQEPPNTVSELNLYRRDRFSGGGSPASME